MNIILIGFMGCGKTTIGRKLAIRLGYRFIDMDCIIEEEQKRKIPEIFKTQGESAFRKLETDLLKRLAATQNTVISTGGGIVTVKENIELIRGIGASVYLKTNIDAIFERVMRNKNRPLLQTENPRKTIEDLLAIREPAYSQADLTIETDSLNVGDIVSEIIREL